MILIVVNTKKDENSQNDYFNDEELYLLEKLCRDAKIDYDIIDGELEFIDMVHNTNDFSNIKVLNLTRTGSINNKKSLLKSYCDIRQIKCISSSVMSVNLCRNKKIINKLFKDKFVAKQYCECDLNYLENSRKMVILKKIQSAGSDELDYNKIGYVRKNNGEYLLNEIDLLGFDNKYVLDEFIDGIEMEVPFVIRDNEIIILGVCEVIFYFDFVMTQEVSDNYLYYFKLNDKVNLEYIIEVIKEIIDLTSIEFYGRVDFKIGNINDTSTYKVFDIATTPYFINNSSFDYAFKNHDISKEYKNVLDLIINL